MNDNHDTIQPAPFSRARARRPGRAFRLRPLPATIGVLFVLLALTTAFLIGARAVRFRIEPRPASLHISRGLFSWRLGERYLMLPGHYRIRATRTGYHVLEKRITVNSDSEQHFSFKMRKLPGILSIVTRPDVHPRVYVDQKPVGKAPVELTRIAPGIHDIRIAPERYLPYNTDVRIKGMRIAQTVSARLKPAWANVSIDTRPEGATLLVDGKKTATTPATVALLGGSRELQLEKPGYKIWQSNIKVHPGKDQSLSRVDLIRADGKIRVATRPSGAMVTIGGRYIGQSPLEVTLAPGKSYAVLLSKVGYAAEKRTIEVGPDKDIDLDTRLKPITGIVRLQVTPTGGELFIDGKSAGKPSQRLKLTAREHHLEIVKAGYATWKTTVTPQPGFEQQLMVALQTREQAKIAAIPQKITTSVGVTLKLIIPGEFEMGAGRHEPGRRANEIQKRVKLTKPFYLGIDEVTNAQFEQFDPGHNSGYFGQAVLNDSNRPVVNVSWDQAAQFCNWLSNQQGLPAAYVKQGDNWVAVSPMNNGFRLPTEAEWAWAARYANGPHPTRFPWGNYMPPTSVDGNYADESAKDMVPYIIDGYNDHYRGPSPVGSFPPNKFGIYDLAGNVSEWVNDYYSVAIPRGVLINPMGPSKGQFHVIRGSNYTTGRFSKLRWTYRDYGNKARPYVGFRIARYVK